jgi:hypothetical protein
MPSPPRIDFADAVDRVTSRGNGRADIFRNVDDRQRFPGQRAHHLQVGDRSNDRAALRDWFRRSPRDSPAARRPPRRVRGCRVPRATIEEQESEVQRASLTPASTDPRLCGTREGGPVSVPPRTEKTWGLKIGLSLGPLCVVSVFLYAVWGHSLLAFLPLGLGLLALLPSSFRHGMRQRRRIILQQDFGPSATIRCASLVGASTTYGSRTLKVLL